VCLDEFVAELLHLDRTLEISLRPEKVHALAQNCDASGRALHRLRCCLDCDVESIQQSNRVRHAIEHELRERFCSIERDISVLLNCGFNIYTVCPQARKQAIPVALSSVPSNPHSLFGYPPNPNTISSFGPNGLPTGAPVGVTAFDANMPTMYEEHYSLQTEYDLGHQWVATLGYQGSLSRHTFFQYDENAVASVQGLALNPQVNGLTYYGNNGFGNYNAGLAEIRHQFSQQFMVDSQYTWAKGLDTSSSPYVYWYYPYDPALSYGRSDYNVGQAFKLYGMYQPVFFRGTHSWIEKLAGGWSLSGIFNLHTGFPWSPVYDTSAPLYCSVCNSYSQLLPGAYLGGAGHSTSNDAYKSGPGVGNGVNQNFPLAATSGKGAEVYFAPPAYQAGPAFPNTGGATPQPPGIARNSLTGPGYKDVDATLSKAFGLPRIPGLGENARFEFRADAYNLFNNLNFKPSGQSNGGSIIDNIALPNFGQAQAALGSRTIDMMARFSF
jgi:hypothetical protein